MAAVGIGAGQSVQVRDPHQTLIAIEAGHYAPSLELAFRIARAFDKGIEEVFSYGSPT